MMDKKTTLILVLKALDQKICYLEEIAGYPASKSEKHFDNDDPIAEFFKSVAVSIYTETCCLIVNYLHNTKAYRFTDMSETSDWSSLLESNEYKNIKKIRDQFAGHQDSTNNNNDYPLSRIVGEIDSKRITEIRVLVEGIKKQFLKTELQNGNDYEIDYFKNPEAKAAIKQLLETSNPKTTNAMII